MSTFKPRSKKGWLFTQSWHDVLFIHWPVEIDRLRRFVPELLCIDTFDQEAWVTLIPFSVSHFRARFTPPVPFLHRFFEVNFRTYVTYDGVPGVYFIRLDASSKLAVFGAKTFFHLPYFYARITMNKDGKKRTFQSVRDDGKIFVHYEPKGSPIVKDPLSTWLVERYRLYTMNGSTLYYEDLFHKPWTLEDVEIFECNETFFERYSLTKRRKEPIYHYARLQNVFLLPQHRLHH